MCDGSSCLFLFSWFIFPSMLALSATSSKVHLVYHTDQLGNRRWRGLAVVTAKIEDGLSLIVECQGLEITVPLSVTVHIYFGVDWFVAYYADMADAVIGTQLLGSAVWESDDDDIVKMWDCTTTWLICGNINTLRTVYHSTALALTEICFNTCSHFCTAFQATLNIYNKSCFGSEFWSLSDNLDYPIIRTNCIPEKPETSVSCCTRFFEYKSGNEFEPFILSTIFEYPIVFELALFQWSHG